MGAAAYRTYCESISRRQRSFAFRVNIPEKLPPSLRLDKHSGISYKLIATLKVRMKKYVSFALTPGGFSRKRPTRPRSRIHVTLCWRSMSCTRRGPFTGTSTHDLRDSVPEEFDGSEGPYAVKLYRNKRAFGPTDQLDLRVIVSSQNPKKVKLKSITVSVRQTVTYLPDHKRTSKDIIDQKSEVLVSKTKNLRQKIHQGEFVMQDMDVIIPKKHTIMSIHTAKHIEISHDLRVVVQIDKESITLDRIDVLISGFFSSVSMATMARIGPVPALELEPDAHPNKPPTVFMQETMPAALPAGTQTAEERPTIHNRRRTQQPQVAPTEIYTNGDMSIPEIDTNDALFLGTATPRMASTSGEWDAPASMRSPMQVSPTLRMRPGDIVQNQNVLRPSSYSDAQRSPTSPTRILRHPSMLANESMPRASLLPPPTSTSSSSSNVAASRPSTYVSAEQEKVRLFERARAEAQEYQAQYEGGASFPTTSTSAAAVPLLQPPQKEAFAAAAPMPAAAPMAAPSLTSTYPTAEQEKAQLATYEATSAGAAPPPTTRTAPAISIPASEDVAASLPSPALNPSILLSAPSSPRVAQHPTTPFVASDEKEQVRRYYEAQDAVARHLQGQSSTGHPSAASVSYAAPTDVEAPAPAPFLTKSEARAVDEKSKLQSYYAQLDQAASMPAPAPTHTMPMANDRTQAPPPRPPKVPLP